MNESEPKDELKKLQDDLALLKEENSRLKSLLDSHGIAWEAPPAQNEQEVAIAISNDTCTAGMTPSEKIALFKRLFRGRQDVFPLRWESAKTGKAGYSPACSNEWRPGVCHKPKVKCALCDNRSLKPVTDAEIYDHLTGKQTMGVYPLLPDDTCLFLAVDFDKAEWRKDATAFMESCHEINVPAALEISRSRNGAHAWIFFSEAVSAREARSLGTALICHTCARLRQSSLESYDRLFPNQDTLPKGGFGNLIALPLQKIPRERGGSVFVRDDFTPYPDQWSFLASLISLSRSELEDAILRTAGGRHPLDVVLANQIFIQKDNVPQPLLNKLIRLAAFQNLEFYKAQAMRMPVWDKPRIIGCAENYPQHIGLPRGCFPAVQNLLQLNEVGARIQDERLAGAPIKARFRGNLRKDQKAALKDILKNDVGTLCAPTAFGKTIVGAALIAKRKVSTLVLVHRANLMRQWQERLSSFLDLPSPPGVIGGGKDLPTGKVDIAIMQSLGRREDLATFLDNYGQVIVDECHHISAYSFEAILKQAKAKYVIGLTATPIRRDGHHPILFLQCGDIVHKAKMPENAPVNLEVFAYQLDAPQDLPEDSIQEVFRIIVEDEKRNNIIIQHVLKAYEAGRKILLLTERTRHLQILQESLEPQLENCFVLHGRMTAKQRSSVYSRLVGEGFDHPPLDTLFLAMPISWKGTLQQYAGRLHREHSLKQHVRIYDYCEHDHPQLARMWNKRLSGYKSMGYEVVDQSMGPKAGASPLPLI
ncbi:TOTE conflict system archaeo-eukaryotic primase domain-containing protein [Desulfovibrio inopinatus]|uniref:TOTE conflict system archaeo-eukaryotic primase domain-containing protein n=1 Tax=Desulfovibrio inopinatus TaxID=102109 RepID=UPI000401DBE1|nr:DEAD/DEAH box helicase [Desulfovibrio inopinatus]